MSNEHATNTALRYLRRIENGLLAILVLVLVGLAGTQIVLRVFFETGLAWADSFSRSLVLWTGMLGALEKQGVAIFTPNAAETKPWEAVGVTARAELTAKNEISPEMSAALDKALAQVRGAAK